MSVVIVIVLGLKVALFARNSSCQAELLGRPPSGNNGTSPSWVAGEEVSGNLPGILLFGIGLVSHYAYIERLFQPFWIFWIISYRLVHKPRILPELCIDIYWKCFRAICWGFCRIWENLDRIAVEFGWVLLWFISCSKTLDIDVLSFSDLY